MKKLLPRNYINFIILIALIVFPSSSYSLEYTFQPRVITGYMYYEFEDNIDYVKGGNDSSKFDGHVPFIGLGTTFIINNYFVDGYLKKTGEAEDKMLYPTGSGRINKFSRQDFSISFGYSFEKNIAIFTGYKHYKTDVDVRLIIPKGLMSDGSSLDLIVPENHESHGPFIGLAYGLPLGKGLLSFKIATAYISLKTYDRTNISNNTKSDSALGITLGTGWKAPILNFENWLYNINFNYEQYEYDSKVEMYGDDLEGNINEKIINLNLAIIYNF